MTFSEERGKRLKEDEIGCNHAWFLKFLNTTAIHPQFHAKLGKMT